MNFITTIFFALFHISLTWKDLNYLEFIHGSILKSQNLQEQNIQAELDYVKSQSENAVTVQEEAQELRERLSDTQNSLNLTMGENERLAEELTRQQALYTELKKMRGRGEEMDMLQKLEQVNTRTLDIHMGLMMNCRKLICPIGFGFVL